jgi:3-hydroxy-9,10-secoandrosta-1,3,5(10)-triene-9,17-dione monooxygenase reductase component
VSNRGRSGSPLSLSVGVPSVRTEEPSNGAGEGTASDIDAASLRKIMGHYTSGLTIVASIVDAAPVGLTCQSFFSVSLEPPLVALSVGKSSTSFQAIRRAEAFSVNVLAAHHRRISDTFGRSGTDKWRGVDWHHGSWGQPVLEGAVAWLECRIRDVHDAGDHEIVVADVLDIGCDETAEPLIFFRSKYHMLISGELPPAGPEE